MVLKQAAGRSISIHQICSELFVYFDTFCTLFQHLNIHKIWRFKDLKSFSGKVLKEAEEGSSSSHQSSDLPGSRERTNNLTLQKIKRKEQPDSATKTKLSFVFFLQIYFVPPLILNIRELVFVFNCEMHSYWSNVFELIFASGGGEVAGGVWRCKTQ